MFLFVCCLFVCFLWGVLWGFFRFFRFFRFSFVLFCFVVVVVVVVVVCCVDGGCFSYKSYNEYCIFHILNSKILGVIDKLLTASVEILRSVQWYI